MILNTILFLCLPGESLRVCVHPGPSCCTSKMEDSYMAAVRSETQQKMRSYSFELKYLIAGHTKAYHGEEKKRAAFLWREVLVPCFTPFTLPNIPDPAASLSHS